MITYNHEQFIAQAIEGVSMQETTFPFELVIGEDCSPDRTREIVLAYHKRHPDKIILLLHEENMGAFNNSFHTFKECQGGDVFPVSGIVDSD